jgi:uncharacterized protein HemX
MSLFSGLMSGGSTLKTVLWVVAGLAALGVGGLVYWQDNRLDELAMQATDARQAALAAQAVSDTLIGDLASQREQYAQQEASFERALAEKDRQNEERRKNASELVKIVTVEKESDPDLSNCLAYQLPASILQQLPK